VYADGVAWWCDSRVCYIFCFFRLYETRFKSSIFNGTTGKIVHAIDTVTTNVPTGWCPSSETSIYFSKNETKVYFGLAPFPYKWVKDTLLSEEKVKLDVWSWHDPRIQPEQLKSQRRDRNKTFLAVVHQDGKMVQLADEDMPQVRSMSKGDSQFALGISSKEYERERNWEYPWKSDFYAVDVQTGDRKLLVQGNRHGVVLSPSGKYVVWYDGSDSTWYGKKSDEVGNAKGTPITKGANDNFSSWNNGAPYESEPYGVVGWIPNEEKLLIRAEFDLWLCDPTGKTRCVNLTVTGKTNRISFNYLPLSQDEEYINIDSAIWVTGFNKQTKDQGYYRLEPNKEPQAMLVSPHKYLATFKADKGQTVLFRRQNHHDFPNLWQTDTELKTPVQVSDANPQQKDYAWGDVRMVHWTEYDGKEHDGLLYLPEQIQYPETTAVANIPKFPMIVYYYEDYSDDIHNHNPPRPTASIIHPTEYISNGYAVFIPDIHYKPGEPGKSAYNSIMSGTDHVLANYSHLIDSTKMGLQGQSWGGYQTAWLVTQTHRFKAAMAGAPVSNMISAYGGIRWGSGMSRQFQYERTQSRIGYTPWDSLDLYIQNSPVFYLPNVTTPLLIMHNDDDGAVPWYQGIEMFMGLRRLQKPVWMLNYNGDEHNLMKRANRKDLSIRMMQFFNHYLKDAPAPDWLINGLPATDKGRRMGYELIDKQR
jgi:dipeptidyl aminopeptidase/acylaminoacyl peptidase